MTDRNEDLPQDQSRDDQNCEAAAATEELSFEESLQQLDTIVRQLEAGELELSDALRHYEAGVGFLRQCHSELENAERKIEVLQNREGRPQLQPFDDRELSLQEKQSERASRRS